MRGTLLAAIALLFVVGLLVLAFRLGFGAWPLPRGFFVFVENPPGVLLPNLVGPITVYATLTVPSAILQESFLSFLGIGVQPPLPTWGSLASEAVQELSPTKVYWWMLLYPCALLVVTLLSLNFLGDALRDALDPRAI